MQISFVVSWRKKKHEQIFSGKQNLFIFFIFKALQNKLLIWKISMLFYEQNSLINSFSISHFIYYLLGMIHISMQKDFYLLTFLSFAWQLNVFNKKIYIILLIWKTFQLLLAFSKLCPIEWQTRIHNNSNNDNKKETIKLRNK